MSANQAAFPVAAMARALGVSEAGHHAWRRRAPSARGTADAALLKRIRTVHAVSRGTCGAPRVHAELRAEGRPVGRKRVARLMRAAGLAGVSRRRGTRTATRRDATRRPGRRRTWWSATSRPRSRTSSGWRTSPTSRPGRASSTWPWCWTRSAAASSAGRWPTTSGPTWFWRRSTWPSAGAGPTASSTIPTRAASSGSTGRRNTCVR